MNRAAYDFVRRAPYRLWLTSILAIGFAAGAGVWKTHQLNAQTAERKQMVVALQEKLAREKVAAATVNPRLPSLQHHARLLQWDLNKAFLAMEMPAPPGMTLLQAHLDVNSAALRLEYRLPDIASASELSMRLNAGYPSDAIPWSLESVSATSPAPNASDAAGYRGVWMAKIDRL